MVEERVLTFMIRLPDASERTPGWPPTCESRGFEDMVGVCRELMELQERGFWR